MIFPRMQRIVSFHRILLIPVERAHRGITTEPKARWYLWQRKKVFSEFIVSIANLWQEHRCRTHEKPSECCWIGNVKHSCSILEDPVGFEKRSDFNLL